MIKSKLNNVFSPLFLISSAIAALFAIWAVIAPNQMGDMMTIAQQYLAVTTGWLVLFLPFFFIVLLLYLGFHPKYRDYVIGGPGVKPDYTTFSWIAMLFAAGIGVGIVYFAVNSALYAYFLSPSGMMSGASTTETIRNALGLAFYQWGPQAWAIFSISGLVVGYFAFQHKTKYLPGEALAFGFKDRRWAAPAGKVMNIMACVCAALTIATSVGLGSGQLAAGTFLILGIDNTPAFAPFVVLFLLFVATAASSILPTEKGMRVIGNWNVYIFLGLMVFVMFFGPTRFIFETIFQTIGAFLSIAIPINFELFLLAEEPSYVYDWNVVTMQWWLSWTPFMAVFIASISRGRTLKQFSLATISVPALFMLLWLSTFGGIALLDMFQGEGTIAGHAMEHAHLTFFAILDVLPMTQLTIIVTIALLFLSLVTTYTSCSLSLSRMTDREGLNTSPARAFIWCLLMALIAVAAIAAQLLGGNNALNAIRALATTIAFPYIFFFMLTISAFIKQFRNDFAQPQTAVKAEPVLKPAAEGPQERSE